MGIEWCFRRTGNDRRRTNKLFQFTGNSRKWWRKRKMGGISMKIEIDKPVVPKWFDDWYKTFGGNKTKALYFLNRTGRGHPLTYCIGRKVEGYSDRLLDLFGDGGYENAQEYLSKAILYGYEVEEEQKYNVKFKVKSSFGTVGIFLYKEGDEVLAGDNFKVYYPKEDVYRLTEQEIRDFQNGDILFEHFAVKVEEA